MQIEYDTKKEEANQCKHGVSLADAALIDWSTALIVEDDRRDYGETRYQATGELNNRLYFIIFTPRNGAMRVISMRQASKKEVQRYEQVQNYRHAN